MPASGQTVGSFAIRGVVTLHGVPAATNQLNQLASATASAGNKIGRSSKDSRRGTMAMLELSRAAEDATIVFSTQGLAGSLRASANNISQVANILSPAAGAITGFAVAGLTMLIPMLERAGQASKEATKQFEKTLSKFNELATASRKRLIMHVETDIDTERLMRNFDLTGAASKLEGNKDALAKAFANQGQSEKQKRELVQQVVADQLGLFSGKNQLAHAKGLRKFFPTKATKGSAPFEMIAEVNKLDKGTGAHFGGNLTGSRLEAIKKVLSRGGDQRAQVLEKILSSRDANSGKAFGEEYEKLAKGAREELETINRLNAQRQKLQATYDDLRKKVLAGADKFKDLLDPDKIAANEAAIAGIRDIKDPQKALNTAKATSDEADRLQSKLVLVSKNINTLKKDFDQTPDVVAKLVSALKQHRDLTKDLTQKLQEQVAAQRQLALLMPELKKGFEDQAASFGKKSDPAQDAIDAIGKRFRDFMDKVRKSGQLIVPEATKLQRTAVAGANREIDVLSEENQKRLLSTRKSILQQELSRRGFGGQLLAGKGSVSDAQSISQQAIRDIAKASDPALMEIRDIEEKQLQELKKVLKQLEKNQTTFKSAKF